MQPQKQILIVEDNDLNREMLREILSEQYTVLEAGDGREALDVLARQGGDVALILLDVMMPVMDGFAFLDRIKGDAHLSLIPVIVMTQSDNEADEVAALAHGATDFVPKPYRPQVILHRVASIISLRETAAMVNQLQYDRLTGLYSKDFFFRKAREVLLENPGRDYNLVCSNVENFKLYNDTFGTAAGDQLLQEIAGITRQVLGPDAICGRFSGDRFVCLQEREKERADRLDFDPDQKTGLAGGRSVVMKWGIYEITDLSVPLEQMCDRALLAADSIKGQYNRFFAVYDDALRGKLLREQAITDAMETALREGQFAVYLQPKYSLHNDGLAGAEALVRWNHPEWGFMSPGEFIPLFEKNGFITRLDQYVWEQVCALLKAWREKGYPLLPVSVNVSRADVYQPDLAGTLARIVEKYGVEPAWLHLEITESAYTENPNQIIETVDRLREMGFIIEMDDFGSGYSSLNMLNQMKLDILKLDMKFIQSETAKPVEQGILRFIVSLARWMNLGVVAEGVETRQQLDRLREIGCDYVQGYFFAKPMPAGDFEVLLRSQIQPSGREMAPRCQDEDMWGLLVVDDDADFRQKIQETFRGQCRVMEAADAHAGLSCIRSAGKEGVSAVILSLTLPGDGAQQFLQAMRQDPLLWRTPVLGTMPWGCRDDELARALDTDDFLCKCHPMWDLRRRVGRIISIAAYQERERVLKDAAYRDYLTGLLNRRGLFAAVDALRQEDLPLAMYLFDLDDLKKVNDRCGHETGDGMLRFFADLLRRQTREGDILCRYGGDEFVVILRRISSVETILRKGEEICQGLRAYRLPDGTGAACSGGIALCSGEEKPSAKLIERADEALYYAKQHCKGGCWLWRENGLC